MKKAIIIYPTAADFDKEMLKKKISTINKSVIITNKDIVELHIFDENIDLIECGHVVNDAAKRYKREITNLKQQKS